VDWGVLLTVAFGLLSVVATWFFAWFYYVKANPTKASARSVMTVAKKLHDSDPGIASAHASLQIALELIEGLEAGEITMPEFDICARTMGATGELLREPIKSAYYVAAQAGVTTSRPWVEAYENHIWSKLAEVKRTILQQLGKEAH
jgi:hypothetical protein